jgi:hypothetical protein
MADTEDKLVRKLPDKANRRRPNIIHFGPEEFPEIKGSKTPQSANKHRKTNHEAGPSKGTVSASKLTDITEFQQKLEKSKYIYRHSSKRHQNRWTVN